VSFNDQSCIITKKNHLSHILDLPKHYSDKRDATFLFLSERSPLIMIMREWPILEATVSMNFAVYICLLTTDSYKEAVLKAVNLGNDTDTTGAVTGGLAGLLYGFENIPKNWVEQIARKDDIENLSKRLMQKLATK